MNDPDFPGVFPTPVDRTNAITINIHTDDYPEETEVEWSAKDENGFWNVLDSSSLEGFTSLLWSSTHRLEPASEYRLVITDSEDDGICCTYGKGWLTITNATTSVNHEKGTVMWNATGDSYESRLELLISVDSEGRAGLVEEF